MEEVTTTDGGKKREAEEGALGKGRFPRTKRGPVGEPTEPLSFPPMSERYRDWKVIGSAIQTGTFLSRFSAGENRKTAATRMAA